MSEERSLAKPMIEVSPKAAEKLAKAVSGIRVNLISPEVAEQLRGSIKFPTLIGPETAAAFESIRNMPGLGALAEASRALEGIRLSSVSTSQLRAAELAGATLRPVGATQNDVAAVTEAVRALHDALIEQSEFLLNQSIRQDRMDRRVFWMEFAIGVLGLVLAVAAIVVAIILS